MDMTFPLAGADVIAELATKRQNRHASIAASRPSQR